MEVVISSPERKKRIFIACSLVIPMVLLIGLMVILAVDLFRTSFTNQDGYSAGHDWIRLDNYIAMLKSKGLWMSLENNAVCFVEHSLFVPAELAFAVLLTFRLRMAKFYKTMVSMPYIINGTAIACAFSYFFSSANGAFDAILSLFHLDSLIRNWLSDTKIVNYVLTSASLWRFSGYHVVLFMAALRSLSQNVQEAAEVDGANTQQLFRCIQIPPIMLMVDFVLFDNIHDALQVFDIPYVMVSGGPGYTSSIFTLYTIDATFKYSNFGLTSTMAVAIMLIIMVIYLIQDKIIHRVVLKGMEK